MLNKSRFLKPIPNKKVIGIILILNFSCSKHYKTYRHIFWSAKEIQKKSIQKCWKLMNKIVNKFLLAGDKFMPEMHLK